MFALRGTAVSLAVFAVVYCLMSVALSIFWQRFRQCISVFPVARVADFLFVLRISPLLLSLAITATLTVPSFLLWEPRSINERIGLIPVLLGLCGMAILGCGILRIVLAIRRASRTIAGWTRQAHAVECPVPLPVLRTSPSSPPMSTVGIFHPRILFSASAESLLDSCEMRTALHHEMAHVSRLDNLKKALLCMIAFPGMRGLEAAWLEATEMAADDAACANATEALDLAGALIKLSRLAPVESYPEMAIPLLHSSATSLNDRVERLIHWSEQRKATRQVSSWYPLLTGLALLTVVAMSYSHLLIRVHEATEWLVR
jgi:Zn-dependent protease with chaperone function